MISKRRVFKSGKLERAYRRDGFVVVPFASRSRAEEAIGVFERHRSGIEHGYHASMHSTDTAYKQAVDGELVEHFWPHLEGFFDRYTHLIGAFMVKPPGGGSVVPPHQDWNMIDERFGNAMNCWIPVTEVNEASGRLWVLPGSHRYVPEGLRGSPGIPTCFDPLIPDLIDDFMEPVDVPLGSTIIFDGRLLHRSPDNMTDTPRVAAYFNVVPAELTPIHYYHRPGGDIEGYRVDRSFFSTFNIGEEPRGERFATISDYEVAVFPREELERRHRIHRLRRLLPV